MFGRKIIPPINPKSITVSATASEEVFPIISETKMRSVNVPRSAPKMNGIAFFRLIKRDTANGTKSPIVILDEKTIAVNVNPIKYALYFESKYLFMNFLAFSSPPKTSIIDLLKYLNAIRRVMNANSRINALLFLLNIGFIIGDVIISIMFGTFMKDIFSPNCVARKKDVFENSWKKNSRGKTIATRSAL